ncbi:MAG: TIGR02206 family membrane protein [Calditrichaeota bacterium]|nr:TIGR02206 family membrane protein [Calditrichota bacterium]MCB0300886.1 TIGR02206 family membrane protein [Calditrichota bacterium]
MTKRVLTHNSEFRSYDRHHKWVLLVTFSLTILLPLIAINWLSLAQQVWLNRLMAMYLSGTIIVWTFVRLGLKRFDYKNDLPLDICNIIALFLPIAMWQPTQSVNEILYFWVLVGTLQAIITPNVEDGFPTYTFFKYFTVHSGLVVYIIYSTTVFGLYPDWISIWKSIAYLHIYAVLILIVNLLIGSNYFYILRKPNKPSLLDYLGPWPWYLLACEVLIAVLCLVVYLPVWLLR